MMAFEKAIEHIRFKLSQKYPMTDTDKEALNSIITYYNDTQKDIIHRYRLFAKVYIVLFKSILHLSKTSVFDDYPNKRMHDIMKKPVEQHAQEFKDFLNESEMYSAFNLSGSAPFDHVHISRIEQIFKDKGQAEAEYKPKLESIIQRRKKSNQKLWEFLEANPDVKEYIISGKEIWTYETVQDNLNSMINKAILNYE